MTTLAPTYIDAAELPSRRAICEQPGDDASRLVFADWLSGAAVRYGKSLVPKPEYA